MWIVDKNGILLKNDVKNVASAEIELSPKFGIAVDADTKKRAEKVLST
ncbi:MAG: hypothetical protein ACYS8W_07010 [Planctomycetota bacterium]